MRLILVIVAVGYWAVGWGLAYGPNEKGQGRLVGGSNFFLNGETDFANFFFQYVFASTAATIISGAVAERVEFWSYIVYSVGIGCIILRSLLCNFHFKVLYIQFLRIGVGQTMAG